MPFYHLEEIKRKLAERKGSFVPEDSDSIDQLIELELMLSDAFLLYGSHLLAGRINPESIDPEWSANRRGMDMSLVLESAVLRGEIKNTLAQLSPGQVDSSSSSTFDCPSCKCNDSTS